MKQFKRLIERDGNGFVVLMAEEAEDMWHIYNLIRVGDVIKASTIRKVVSETSTGTTSSQRVHTMLTISVETIDFDPGAQELHLKGRNIEENDIVKLGAYHTIDIEPNRKFTLQKTEWDSIDIERLNLSLDPAQAADVAAVVLHEGLANVCLITPAMTLTRAKIDMTIPRKRKGFTNQHEKGLEKFYEAVSAAFMRHVNLQVVKCVIVASRGFVKDAFYQHLQAYADANGKKLTTEQKSKFLLTHSSSGFKHALKEVLETPQVAARLADTKAQGEVKALNHFLELLSTEPDRAFYGYSHVNHANQELAIETLLVADSLFRAQNIETRRKYVKLVESVREQNGKVHIFSSMHVSGEQLAQLTGCAAILRFPMPDLDDEPMSDEEK
uniref:Protein pelota homolog n=1 Tax=Caenorhabditis tropicalis TaxID=1561998 RepID=A0A1I7TT25_9PELO